MVTRKETKRGNVSKSKRQAGKNKHRDTNKMRNAQGNSRKKKQIWVSNSCVYKGKKGKRKEIGYSAN
jgi:hypothetical protein